MSKNSFWNFLGLADKKNFSELEERIEEISLAIVESNKHWEIKNIDNQEDLQSIKKLIVTKNSELEAIINENNDKLFKKIENNRKILDLICENETSFTEIVKEDDAILKEKLEVVEESIINHYVKLVEHISEYNAILKSSDWKIATALSVYKHDLENIVDRIENMNPIINLEKIEALLKMLVINGLMDEIEN